MGIKPFLTGKAGIVAFPIKVLSPDASYVNLAFQGEFGVEVRVTKNIEIRADPHLSFFKRLCRGQQPWA